MTLYYIIAILIFLLIVALYFCFKFALIVLRTQDALSESLDILDQKYQNLAKILEIPIFYDSTEVKRAINEVEDAKNVILYIANRLTESVQQKAIIDDEDNQSED